MPGAAVLAGQATLKTGAGLLTIASTDLVIHHVANHCPEATYIALPEKNGELISADLLNMGIFDAVALGVGLGRQAHTRELLHR